MKENIPGLFLFSEAKQTLKIVQKYFDHMQATVPALNTLLTKNTFIFADRGN